MTNQEAARIVAVILAACPSQASKLDGSRAKSMVDTYATLLEDLSYEQCNAAVRVLLQTNTWMPSVAEIRKAAVELERGPVHPGGEAWGSVKAAVSRFGSYRAPGVDFQFDDPITARCVAALGWSTLCLSENEPAERARFIELYDRLAAQQNREALSPLLAASAERRRLEAGVARGVRALAPNTPALPPARRGFEVIDGGDKSPWTTALQNLFGEGDEEESA